MESTGVAPELTAWLASAEAELDAITSGARAALRDGVPRSTLAPRILSGVLQRIEDGYSDDLIGALVLAILDRAESAELPERDAELAQLKARLAEYESTITWNTTCHGCAKQLDTLYAERVAGYREGRAAAAEAIRPDDGFEHRYEQAYAARIADPEDEPSTGGTRDA